MKKLLVIAAVVLSTQGFSQTLGFGNDITSYYSPGKFVSDEADNVNIIGTVMLKGDVWVIHGSAGGSGEVQDYYPTNLAKNFTEEGLRVTVQATLDPVPDGVRMAGTPITIISIQKL